MTRKIRNCLFSYFRGTDGFRAFCNRYVFAYFACHDRLFHTTSSQVQLGLTASMIGLAVGQLFSVRSATSMAVVVR